MKALHIFLLGFIIFQPNLSLAMQSCPGFDETQDIDSDGIPDGCDNSWQILQIYPDPQTYAFEWLAAAHSIVPPDTYIKIVGTKYIIYSSANGSLISIPSEDYNYALAQQCDQVSGVALESPPGYPLMSDLSGFSGLMVEHFADWNGDLDGDGVINGLDNCVNDANPGQDDANYDGMGDACDLVSVPDMLGLFRVGTWFLDLNDNGQWDSGLDATSVLGTRLGDKPVVGDWDGNGKTERGIYRNGTWYLDYNGNGVWDGTPDDKLLGTFGNASDTPVVGDWNGDRITDLGLYRSSTNTWYLDLDGNGVFDPTSDQQARFGKAGDQPVVGDWDGLGTDRIGLYRSGLWYLDLNGNGSWDNGIDRQLGKFGQAADLPVVGDWGGTGVDCPGLYRNGMWYLDLNGNGLWEPGSDRQLGKFGQATDTPLVGIW